MRRRQVTRLLYRVHSWLGLASGLFILMVSVTGAALVYHDELDLWWHHSQLTVAPRGERLSLDSLVTALRSRYPSASAVGIVRIPGARDQAWGFRLYDLGHPHDQIHAADLYAVDMDPYTGRIVREGSYRRLSVPLQWLHLFHYSLMAGTWGVLILAIVCLTVFTSLVTGVVVFRRHLLDALRLRILLRRGGWRRATSGLHRLVGVWALVFTLLIFYSGFEMVWGVFSPSGWGFPALRPPLAPPRASVERMYRQTLARWPGFVPTYVYVPFEEGDSVIVSGDSPGTPLLIMRGASRMAFDPHTGGSAAYNINAQSLGTRIAASTYSFHVGSFGGRWSRAAYVIIGLLPGLLSISGFLLWWRRTRPHDYPRELRPRNDAMRLERLQHILDIDRGASGTPGLTR
jgi:uncharacterized iron-regulated membrane protein